MSHLMMAQLVCVRTSQYYNTAAIYYIICCISLGKVLLSVDEYLKLVHSNIINVMSHVYIHCSCIVFLV